MKKLSKEGFASAREYLISKARPLERALFNHHFQGGSAVDVLAALEEFQNDDGGFGHALEPDVRTPSSSALAAGIGLRLLVELGAPGDHPLVQGVLGYLRDTFDDQTLTWRVIPMDANKYPHAPWWDDDGESLAKTFDAFKIIPRAEITGYLYHYSAYVDSDWLASIAADVIEALEIMPLGTGGGDDLVYAIRLGETAELPAALRRRVVERVREVAPQVVTTDPDQWAAYSIPPLKIAPQPDSLTADLLAVDVQRNLDYMIDQQTNAGTWDPVWSWGDMCPDVWPMARDEWRGELTLSMLISLRAYGRLRK